MANTSVVDRWLDKVTRIREFLGLIGIVYKYREVRKFPRNAILIPDPYFEVYQPPANAGSLMQWTEFKALLQNYLLERYNIDNNLDIIFVANTFYTGPNAPNFGGAAQRRYHRTNEILDFIEANLPGAKVMFSCDKMTKSSQHAYVTRDPLWITTQYLKRPTTPVWPNSTWHWEMQNLGNNNWFEDNNRQGNADFRIHPQYTNDTAARPKFYARISVPPEHRQKWARIKFEIHYSQTPATQFRLRAVAPYAVLSDAPAETVLIDRGNDPIDYKRPATNGNRTTGQIPNGPNTNYSWWDNVNDVDYVTVDLHTHFSEILFRVDFTWGNGVQTLPPTADPMSAGWVTIRNFTIGDNFILDDITDGAMPYDSVETSERDKINSLDFTPLAALMYNVEPDYWVQGYKYLNWPAAFHHDEIQNWTKSCVDNVITYFGSRSCFAGFFWECDELYNQAYDRDFPSEWSAAEAVGRHYAIISDYIYSLSPNYTIYAYADLCNPGHGGKKYYRGNNPRNNGMQDVLTYFIQYGGKRNVIWLDWGGYSPNLYQQTIDYFDEVGLPWGIAYCRDQDQWSQEGAAGWPLITTALNNKANTSCTAGCEFGFHQFSEVLAEPMHTITLNNLTTCTNITKADSKPYKMFVTLLPYNNE